MHITRRTSLSLVLLSLSILNAVNAYRMIAVNHRLDRVRVEVTASTEAGKRLVEASQQLIQENHRLRAEIVRLSKDNARLCGGSRI